MIDARELRQQLKDLNSVVGTDQVDEYKKRIHLPKGWHLDFQLHRNKFAVINHIGMKVFD